MDTDNVAPKEIGADTKKQVFIIGSRRSGTTWTLWLLSNHDSIVGVQHTNLISSFSNVNEWWLDEDPYHNSIVTGNDNKNKSNLKERISNENFYSHCRHLTDMVFSKAFEEKKDSHIVVESQPENIDNLDLLVKLYPDAYFLHVIRDPRSVFSSWKSIAKTWSSPDVFKTNPIDFSKRWLQDITSGRSFSQKVKNYMEVKYEDLQNDGVSSLQDIYKWLGVDSDVERAKKSIDACEIKKLRKKANMPKGFFRKGLHDGWKSELSSSDIKIVEYMLADLMGDLSYQCVNDAKMIRPFKITINNFKYNLSIWFRKTIIFDVLKKIKKRFLG